MTDTAKAKSIVRRFLDEWRNPSKKCARVGHKKIVSVDIVLTRATRGYNSGVADKATKSTTICKRCGRSFGRAKYTDREPVHSLSLPSSQMDKFEKRGVYVLHHIRTEKVKS